MCCDPEVPEKICQETDLLLWDAYSRSRGEAASRGNLLFPTYRDDSIRGLAENVMRLFC